MLLPAKAFKSKLSSGSLLFDFQLGFSLLITKSQLNSDYKTVESTDYSFSGSSKFFAFASISFFDQKPVVGRSTEPLEK